MMTDWRAPVVLVHGALCDAEIWAPQTGVLEAAGLPTVAIFLEGYYPGAFDPARFSATRHVAQIIELLHGLPEPAHLVGHSRGARLALAVAATPGVQLRSLAIVEAGGIRAPDFFEEAEDAAWLDGTLVEALVHLKRDGPEAAVTHYFERGLGQWRQLPERMRVCAIRNALTLRGMAGDPSCPLSRATARAVTCPTLLLEGAASTPIFARVAGVLAEEIPHARRVVLPQADHFMPSTAPGPFNTALLDFLLTLGA